MTAAAATQAAIRQRRVGAIAPERYAMTAKPIGMMISNHHSGTSPARVSSRPRSARTSSTAA